MKSIIINKTEDGIRLNKYIKKILPMMSDSLIYKLLRKNYFEINGKKAKGNEILASNDVLSIYLSDETYDKFKIKEYEIAKNVNDNEFDKKIQYKKTIEKQNIEKDSSIKKAEIVKNIKYTGNIYYNNNIDNILIKKNIVYEDENVIVYNKPVGLLSQGDSKNIESVNSILCEYVLNEKNVDGLFKPSIVNRLDRNTKGLIIFAKTYIAAREISNAIKNEELKKYYKAVVNGIVKKDEDTLIHLYKKDDKNNKAIIKEKQIGGELDGFCEVILSYKVIDRNIKNNTTVLDINLITGKSHQIRAQLSYIGYPIVCDKKYMEFELYAENVKKFNKKSQELLCYKIVFPKFENELLKNLDNKIIELDF